jgi:hypothetical protein
VVKVVFQGHVPRRPVFPQFLFESASAHRVIQVVLIDAACRLLPLWELAAGGGLRKRFNVQRSGNGSMIFFCLQR